MEIEYKLLDPDTLEPSENGMVYKIIDGSYLLQGSVSKTETIRVDDQTVADVVQEFDLALCEYVETSRVTRSQPLPPAPKSLEDQLAEAQGTIAQLQIENAEAKAVGAQNAADLQGLMDYLAGTGVLA